MKSTFIRKFAEKYEKNLANYDEYMWLIVALKIIDKMEIWNILTF